MLVQSACYRSEISLRVEKVLVVDTDGTVVQDGVLLFTARSGALGWGDLAVSYA